MKAIVIREGGVLALDEVDEPPLGPGQLRIRNRATALNRADILQRRGFYPAPPGASPILGLECAGEVEAVGPEVQGWATGDRVCALLAGGGYAERVVVRADHAVRIPQRLDFEAAAAVPEAFLTAFDNVLRHGRLRAGEWLLAHGGGSGVGTAALQLARRAGAHVIVTVGSPEKAERCLALGADAAVRYREEDFVARTRELTSGRGADVILDIMGASYLERNLSALAMDGRLVVIGAMGGVSAPINLGLMLGKRLSLQATTLRARDDAYKAELVQRFDAEVMPGLADGTLRPVVDRVFPLGEAAQAHQVMEASEHFGKIVLRVDR